MCADFDRIWGTRRRLVERCRTIVESGAAAAATESSSVVCIQRNVRGYFGRTDFARKRTGVLRCQRVFRGHRGLEMARARQREVRLVEQMSFFHYQATAVQKIFRGYYSRRYYHDYFARLAYIKTVLQKSTELRVQLAAHRERVAREEQERRMREAQEEFHKVTQNLHHLVSTASCAGIYNSPYMQERVPTAFGAPIEVHLRKSTKELLRTEGLRSVRSRPKKQRISIQAQSKYDALEDADRAESRHSRLRRMSGQNFVAGSRGGLGTGYIPGISSGTPYVEQYKNAARGASVFKADGTKATPFYTAVPFGEAFER